MLSYQVNNIKVSFKITTSGIGKKLSYFARISPHVTKIDGNFFVLRKIYVYIVFYTGHVNCTKIKSVADFQICKNIFSEALSVPNTNLRDLQIDNISSSGDTFRKLNLLHFGAFLSRTSLKFRYNPQRFPGLSVRLKNASFTIFNSGKFIAVGTKSLSDLAILIDIFGKYLDQFIPSPPTQ